jgi:dihydropteroate synthase
MEISDYLTKNLMQNKRFSLNCGGRLIDLSKPQVMAILNITPDSFYEGSRFQGIDGILAQVEKCLNEGATFIDIGGHSTRPNAEAVNQDQELQRVLPVIEAIIARFPRVNISIDTFRSEVAQLSVEAGATLINDIGGGNLDEKMFETVAKLQVPYILMHSRGNPQNMSQLNHYQDLVLDILSEIQQKIFQLRQLFVNDIVIDLGFGFAKNLAQNYELLKQLPNVGRHF